MRKPNVVIVVLDCARASDFPDAALTLANGPTPWFNGMKREAATFPYAVAPGSWTLPSHASLLTGLYPWDHRVHGKETLSLSFDRLVITEDLRRVGYRTQLLSANPVLDLSSGFHRGFDETHVAEWWEPSVRISEPDGHGSLSPRSFQRLEEVLRGFVGRVLQRHAVYELTNRFPLALDLSNRAFYRLCSSTSPTGMMTPWVETLFQDFLRRTPKDQPIFTLINLFDAHEPYITNPASHPTLLDWWRNMRISQQGSLALIGRYRPSREDMKRLHSMYLAALGGLVTRVDSIIGELIDAGRWDDTLFVVTADHGQSFLEPTGLFHMANLDEGVSRVPLMMRFPSERALEIDREQWASLVDVPQLIREYVGLSPAPDRIRSGDRCDLRGDAEPVYAFSEGLAQPSISQRWLSPREFSRLDRIQIAAYRGSYKVCVKSGAPGSQTLRVHKDAKTTEPVEASQDSELAAIAEAARQKLEFVISQRVYVGGPPGGSTVRLASWGYT